MDDMNPLEMYLSQLVSLVSIGIVENEVDFILLIFKTSYIDTYILISITRAYFQAETGD